VSLRSSHRLCQLWLWRRRKWFLLSTIYRVRKRQNVTMVSSADHYNRIGYHSQYRSASTAPNCASMVIVPKTEPSRIIDEFTSYYCDTTSSVAVHAQDFTPTTTSTTTKTLATTRSTMSTAHETSATTKVTMSTLQMTATTTLGTLPSVDPKNSTIQATSGTSTDAPENTTSAEQSSSSTNAGAIGGGIGGGAGAIAVAGVIGYMIHRKRKQRKEKGLEIAM
jgi:hypothetical protein